MALEKESLTLGDFRYEVTQFGAKEGRRVLFRLTKMLGPAAAGLVKGSKKDDPWARLGTALTSVLESAKEEDFEYLCDALSRVTKVYKRLESSTGQEIALDLEKVFDSHFRGRFQDMLAWLAFAIKVNFADFFGGKDLGSGLLGALGLTNVQSESPKN